MTALATVAPKLGALIPRLASDHDGEIIATVRALRRVLEGEGLDLHDLADALAGPPVCQPPRAAPFDARDWRRAAGWCAARAERLSDKEAAFVARLADGGWRRPTITVKQDEWLADIVAKLREGEAA